MEEVVGCVHALSTIPCFLHSERFPGNRRLFSSLHVHAHTYVRAVNPTDDEEDAAPAKADPEDAWMSLSLHVHAHTYVHAVSPADEEDDAPAKADPEDAWMLELSDKQLLKLLEQASEECLVDSRVCMCGMLAHGHGKRR